ncbi:hypothetical protein AB0L74_26435 [Streptomyces sp. NPDC052020]|uniref:hypothetical protein n=1 Tax=Streptomyces sp. NPDC052020 TaxID=3155677 RepID=UPI00342F3BE0
MKRLLGLLGFLALTQGVMGLLHEVTDLRWGVVRRIGFLDGYEVYASVALLALGFALCAAGSRTPR